MESNLRQPDLFRSFMVGFTAAAELHQRAAVNGSFVECVCLGASVVDAMLRVALLLEHQLNTGTAEIIRELVMQGESDKPISEREIYRRALDARIVDDDLFDRLNALYGDRNRVVHRYVISRITTADVLSIAQRYEMAIGQIAAAVHALEQKQIEMGVGVTKPGGDFDRAFLESFAEEKHTPELAKALRASLSKTGSTDESG